MTETNFRKGQPPGHHTNFNHQDNAAFNNDDHIQHPEKSSFLYTNQNPATLILSQLKNLLNQMNL